jgi:chromo domain-containing protein 1
LEEANVLGDWEMKKSGMSPAAFEKWMKKNETAFEKARRKHEDQKALRKKKRAKKRNRLRERNKRLVVDDSEDDIPLIQRRQTKIPPPALVQHDDDLFFKDPPMARRAPLDQSTDDEEDGTESAELNKKVRHRNSMGAQVYPESGLGSSILRPKIAAGEASRPEPDKQSKDQPRKPSRTLTTPIHPTSPQVAGPQQKVRRGSEPAAQDSAMAPARAVIATGRKSSAPTITPHKPAAKPDTSTLTHRPLGSTAPASRKNGTASKLTNPIRMTNGPKEAPPRKPWDSDSKHFNRLKFRGIAEKRSRVEGTPDLDALEFVGAQPPALLKRRTTDPADNPYGRREAGTRRFQELDNDDDTSRGPRDESPLRVWETEKVPQMCAEWRLSSSCRLGAQKCKFLHRATDQNGRDLPMGHLNGLVPPKHRKKPLTCIFWLENVEGCMKSDALCVFAHHNTGYKPESTQSMKPVQISLDLVPASETASRKITINKDIRQPPQLSQARKMNVNKAWIIPPSKLTCWFWTKNSCRLSDKDCAFKHYDTGTVAIPPPSANCRGFMQGHCRKTPEKCRWYHPEEDNSSVQADTIDGASFVLVDKISELTRR